MSTKSRQTIYGGPITGARIRADGARKRAVEAAREADRAEAEAWSLQMEAYGGPAQPSPTIGQCINGGLGWLEVECKRCKIRASLPLDAHPSPAQYADLETGGGTEMPLVQEGPLGAARAHDQADRDPRDRAISLGTSR